jgi:hypothetical protein
MHCPNKTVRPLPILLKGIIAILISSLLWVLPFRVYSQNPAGSFQPDYKELMIGVVYTPKYYTNAHPFLFKNFVEAKLIHKDEVYENIRLNYDLMQQVLVYQQKMAKHLPQLIKINSSYVNSFTLYGQNNTPQLFKRFPSLDNLNSRIQYYEILYQGETTLILGREKKHFDPVSTQRQEDRFAMIRLFYIIKNGRAYRVKNRRDVIKILEDEKKAMKAFKRKHNLKPSPKNPGDMISLLKFYDQLNSTTKK